MAASPSAGPSAAQPATDRPPRGDAAARRRRAAVAGHSGDRTAATALATDPDPSVRATALGALARLGAWDAGVLVRALGDPDPGVRRRAATLAGRSGAAAADTAAAGPAAAGPAGHSSDDTARDLAAQGAALLAATGDTAASVVEAVAWALGELPEEARPAGTVARLAALATGHEDPLCREAAVAALGAIGDPHGLDAVLHALGGKPPLRRRAAVALAAFDDPRADEALRRCGADRDWQVREVVEELLGPGPDPPAGAGGGPPGAGDPGDDWI